MRLSFRHKSLYHQFIVSMLVTVFLPIVIIGSISYYRSSKQVESLVGQLLDKEIDGVKSLLDDMVSEINRVSLELVTKVQIRQFVEQMSDNYSEKFDFSQWLQDSILVEEIFSRIPIVSGVSILGDEGLVYSMENNLISGNIDYMENIDALNSRVDFFNKNIANDGSMKIFITSIKDKKSGTDSPGGTYISLVRRIFNRSGSATKGTIIFDIKASNLFKVWQKKNINQSNIWIIDEKGDILYHPDSKFMGRNTSDYIPETFFQSQEGSFKSTVDGRLQFFTYRTSEKTGWKVVDNISVQQISTPLNNIRNAIIFTCVIALPLALLVGYGFIHSILKPVKRLQKMMAEVEKENWILLEDDFPQNEIGSLMKAYNRMVSKISDLIEKVYKGELKEKKYQLSVQKAEFQALQTQINPHFLYNTLSAINGYAIVADETPIQEMVEALSNMLRYSVQNPLEYVSLCDEVNHVQNYLTIQRYRQEIMPGIQWEVEKYMEHSMLRLTLQPLVENIFQHAFTRGVKDGSKIIIRARRTKELFIVEVEDNGSGVPWETGCNIFDEDMKIKLGIGLKNVHRRLQMAFGQEFGLSIRRGQKAGTVVSVKLPFSETVIKFE